MAFEQFIKLEFSDYGDGIMLNEYNGMISLVSAKQGKENGTNYMRWCYPEKDRSPMEKAVPWGIRLGNKKQAAAVLWELYQSLSKTLDEDDLPF